MCLIIILPWNLSLVVFPSSQLLLNLSSSLLLSLQFLSKFTALSYYCSIEPGWYPNSMSFYQIVPFILLLNSSTNSLFLYLFQTSFLNLLRILPLFHIPSFLTLDLSICFLSTHLLTLLVHMTAPTESTLLLLLSLLSFLKTICIL